MRGNGLRAAVTTMFLMSAMPTALADPLVIEREVQLKGQAEVWSQTVCLSDLLEDGWLQSRCVVDRKACCRWEMGGERIRVFRRAELQRDLSKINLGAFTLELRGGDEITVTQTHREIAPTEIQSRIKAAAMQKFGEDGRGLAVPSLKIQSPIYVAFAEESDWDVVLPESLGERASVKVISTKDGGRVLGWAEAELRLEGEVYVARKMIRPNEAIRPDDFDLRRTNLLKDQAVFRKNQFPEVTRARLTIMAGVALTAGSIERVPMVRLGDTVTLILRSDNLRVSTKGVVQGSAALGEMVTVQLSRYNRTFRGRLIDGRLVEVWL